MMHHPDWRGEAELVNRDGFTKTMRLQELRPVIQIHSIDPGDNCYTEYKGGTISIHDSTVRVAEYYFDYFRYASSGPKPPLIAVYKEHVVRPKKKSISEKLEEIQWDIEQRGTRT
jgi:hypothetical protein